MNQVTINENNTYSTRANYDVGYIYKIVNKTNGKVYIGSTVDIHKRRLQHLNALKGQYHGNRYLQNAWNKDRDSFIFVPIECVLDVNKTIEREQFWIDHHQSFTRNKGYNINPVANSCLGRVLSDETKRNISEAKKRANRKGERSSMFGVKRSDETKKKISMIHKGKIISYESRKNMSEAHKNKGLGTENKNVKLSENDVFNIKVLNKIGNITIAEISKLYSDKVSRSGINNIFHKGLWSHIDVENVTELNEEQEDLILKNELYWLNHNIHSDKNKSLTHRMVVDALVLIKSKQYSVKEIASLFHVKDRTIQELKIGKTKKDIAETLKDITEGEAKVLSVGTLKKYKEYNDLLLGDYY